MTTIVGRDLHPIARGAAKAAAILFAAALLAAPALAQRHASPRGGGGGGGGGGSVGHAPSGGGHSGPSVAPGGGGPSGGAHRNPGSGGSGYSGYSGGYSPHRPTGNGGWNGGHDHGHGGYGHYYGYYGYPYYYSPYYSFSFGFGYPYYYGYYPYYGGYYGYPYYYGYRPYGYYSPYYGSYGGGYGDAYPPAYGGGGTYPPAYSDGTSYDRANLGAVALKVKPKTAEVYVDSRYVGLAGSYDGFPGYLWLSIGSHRLELVQDGYANLDRDIDVGAGQVLEFKLDLQPGEAARPLPPAEREYSHQSQSEHAPYPEGGGYRHPEGGGYQRPEGEGYRPPPPRGGLEPEGDRGEDQAREQRPDLGGLRLDVRPDDASVYLDGRFVGTGRDVSTATEALLVVPGEHRLQVVHPEFGNEDRTVSVKAGEEKLVEVTLHRGAGV